MPIVIKTNLSENVYFRNRKFGVINNSLFRLINMFCIDGFKFSFYANNTSVC